MILVIFFLLPESPKSQTVLLAQCAQPLYRGCEQMASAVRQLESGLASESQPQQGQAITYIPNRPELDAFFAHGHQLFDQAERSIRAQA